MVERGVVAKRGRLGLAGGCFGKDVILSNDNLRDIGDAIALTFVQTISLTQQDIFELLVDYPQAYHIVRKAALRMALVRALVKAAGIVKRSKYRATSMANMSICDIFDQVRAPPAIGHNCRSSRPDGLGASVWWRMTRGGSLLAADDQRLPLAAHMTMGGSLLAVDDQRLPLAAHMTRGGLALGGG